MDKIEYGAVIKYLVMKGKTPTQIKYELDSVYGDSAPSFTTVKFCAAEFKRSRKSLGDDELSGRRKAATTDENIATVHQMVLDDRRIKGGDAGAGLPFPKTTIGSRPNQPVVNILNVIEIPEDRDPLDFLIDEKAVLEEECAMAKPKKSSSLAIGNRGHKDEAECIVVDEEDGAAEGMCKSIEDDDNAVINEDTVEKVEEDGV